jgi:hypothetical protein
MGTIVWSFKASATAAATPDVKKVEITADLKDKEIREVDCLAHHELVVPKKQPPQTQKHQDNCRTYEVHPGVKQQLKFLLIHPENKVEPSATVESNAEEKPVTARYNDTDDPHDAKALTGTQVFMNGGAEWFSQNGQGKTLWFWNDSEDHDLSIHIVVGREAVAGCAATSGYSAQTA